MAKKLSKKKTKTAKTPPLARTILRKTLDAIDAVLCADFDGGMEEAEAARLLWDVLSALRGPDSAHMGSKDATTAVLRRKAFPKTFVREARSAVRLGKAVANDDHESLHLTRLNYGVDGIAARTSTHFYNHAQKGFYALNLKWNEVNK